MEDPDKPVPPTDQNPLPMDGGFTPPPPPPVELAPPPAPMPNYAAAPTTETNTMAIVSLIASIASWVIIPGLGGIIGVICGIMARNQIKASMGRQTGNGLALGGIIVGGVNIGLICIIALCFAAITILSVANSR